MHVALTNMRAYTAFGDLDALWAALLAGTEPRPPVPIPPLPFGDGQRRYFATTKAMAPQAAPVRPLCAASDALIISNACVSGAQALIEAVDAITDNECESAEVLAGDVLTAFVQAGFRALEATSPTTARPFDAGRDGLTLGEAACAVTLRANGDGPRVLAYGCSNDANHISGPSRDGAGLALAIRRAMHGIDRRSIHAICAHGTATRYNDAMEARAYHTIFGDNVPPVFGIKGSLGHTLGAAGLLEIIISAKVAETGLIPPTFGYAKGETDFPLDVVHGEPRRIQPGCVLSTNSGFGGMNTAVIIGPGGA